MQDLPKPKSSAPQQALAAGAGAPVFVVGCYRSGTTLLDRILRCHPLLGGPGFETALFTHILPYRKLPAHNAKRWSDLLEAELGVSRWSEVEGERLAVFGRLMAKLLAEQGKVRWVEKTPFHLFHLGTMARLFPDGKIIYVRRDGRDVVASILGAPHLLPGIRGRTHRLVAACVLWEWMTLEGHRLLAVPEHRSRILELSYEDVVVTPGRVLPRLAGFLDLSSDPGVLREWEKSLTRLESNSSHGAFEGVSARSIGRWRDPTCLNAEEAELVEHLLARTLRVVGYPTGSGSTLGLRRRTRLRLTKWFWSLHRIGRFWHNAGYWPPPHLQRLLRRWPMASGAMRIRWGRTSLGR